MKDLPQTKDKDLLQLLADKKDELRAMNFSLSKSTPGEKTIRGVKKDIARVMTELNRRKKEAHA